VTVMPSLPVILLAAATSIPTPHALVLTWCGLLPSGIAACVYTPRPLVFPSEDECFVAAEIAQESVSIPTGFWCLPVSGTPA
jgi:hypothetical protein